MSYVAPFRQDFRALLAEHRSPARPDAPVYSTRVVPTGDTADRQLDVRIAKSDSDRALAAMLINRMYDWRGYGSNHIIPASDAHSTFLASLDGETVGTITLAVDNGAGLAVDRLFRDEINTFRRVPGASVCELTKLAFDTEMPSRKLMAALFHIVFIYGKRRYRCTDLFIEVNPRHRRFYEAMLGFKPIGPLRDNPSVGAPSQLMHLKVSDIAVQISAQVGRDAASSRSLYPLFLTGADEHDVSARLATAFPCFETFPLPGARLDA